MADVVTSQLLENGPRFAIYKFTNVSDGTGESGVTKVDATSSGPLGVVVQGSTYYPGTHLKVVDVKYSVFSMGLRIQWVASSALDMLVLQATDHWQMLDERGGFGGLYVPPATAGATGSISFTTVGAATGSGYTIIMKLVKAIPQS
jgi:hypothetical protein